MSAPPFTPEQFSRRPGVARVEKDLKLWLLSVSVKERIPFIERLWPIHYRLALILVQSLQLPINEVESLLRYWLVEGNHNTAQQLIQRLSLVLGEKKFWKIASEEKLLPAMRDFLDYHGHGRLSSQARLTR
jgi:hypothetical protein